MLKKAMCTQLLSLINNTPKPEVNVKIEFTTDADRFEAALKENFGAFKKVDGAKEASEVRTGTRRGRGRAEAKQRMVEEDSFGNQLRGGWPEKALIGNLGCKLVEVRHLHMLVIRVQITQSVNKKWKGSTLIAPRLPNRRAQLWGFIVIIHYEP